MGNFKVCLVVLLATYLPSYVHLQDTDDPCAAVRCLEGYGCVANYDDCESEDIHKCIARPQCVIRSATDDTGTFKACNLLCIIGNRCIVKDGKAQCVPDTTTETPPTTPASSWKDPCKTTVCKDGEQCYSIYHTCETGICLPTPVCVPIFEGVEVDVSDPPPVTPAASSWEDPCNLTDCRDGEQCHLVYHTCETGTCPPTPVCVPTFGEAEDDEETVGTLTDLHDETPNKDWQCSAKSDFDKICDKECPETYECRCRTLPAVDCIAGPCLFPVCAAINTKSQQCTEFGDDGKLCEADCLESEECHCITPPGINCFVGPCLFPTCIDKNTYGSTLDNTITETIVTNEN